VRIEKTDFSRVKRVCVALFFFAMNAWKNTIVEARAEYVWARDTNRGGKQFVGTETTERFFSEFYSKTPSCERTFYEIIHRSHACSLYVDLEATLGDARNGTLAEIRMRAARLLEILREFAASTCSGLVFAPERTFVLDASMPERKFSAHVIMHATAGDAAAAFSGGNHCGALMRRFAWYLCERFGAPPRNEFFVWTDKAGETEQIVAGRSTRVPLFDLCVYTQDRQFRLVGCHKHGAPHRKLTLSDVRTFEPCKHEDVTLRLFEQLLVTQRHAARLTDVVEYDGQPARWTSITLAQQLRDKFSVAGSGGAQQLQLARVQLDVDAWQRTFDFQRWFEFLRADAVARWTLQDSCGSLVACTERFDSAQAWRDHAMRTGASGYHVHQFVDGGANLVLDYDCSDLPQSTPPRSHHCECAGMSHGRTCVSCVLLVLHTAAFHCDLMRVCYGEQLLGTPAVFFSGNKGVHVWYCSESARHVGNAARRALAAQLSVPALAANMAFETRVWDVCERWFNAEHMHKHWPPADDDDARAAATLAERMRQYCGAPDSSVLCDLTHGIRCPGSMHPVSQLYNCALPTPQTPEDVWTVAAPLLQRHCSSADA
jgi:hypothetical protein